MVCALFLSLLPAFAGPQSPQHWQWSGAELAAMAGQQGQSLNLAAEESCHLQLPCPPQTRSVGAWWQGLLGTAQLEFLGEKGDLQGPYPMIAAEDLDPIANHASGPAGSAQVAALQHYYGGAAAAVILHLRGPVQLDSLALVFIPKSNQAVTPKITAGGPPGGYPKPNVYSRSSWGADPPVCNPSYCNTTHLGFHHSAGASEYNSSSWSQDAANVKAIQSYHMYTRGWCDIGYNYLISVHGYIFEGRAGGDDVRGAHDGHNCGSMGTCFMGYFHTPYNQTLTQVMIDAAAELGAWKCDQQGIDPHGTSWYSGYGGNMSNVYGHRNVASTACPGDLAYAELPTIRNEIASRLQGGGGTEIILDTGAAFTVGTWFTGTSSTDKYGSNYLWTDSGIQAPRYALWRPNISQAGNYTVYFWWPQGSNRSTQTMVGARIQGTIHSTTVNQQQNGGQWNAVGTWWFPTGTSSLVGVSNQGPTGSVVLADAIRLVKQ
ncbi:MAG: hypothetical protein DWQ01_19150 [Planctomycetota bacterium]|nr:MAG: hypothetical protein DWQ01_19150 [Planctomycetota bacterium]